MNATVTDIKWDTDGEKVDLPQSIIVPIPEDIEEDEIEEYVSDEITKTTGFCHKGFRSSLDKQKKIFKIPVTWEVYSSVEIEATSLDEAIEIFDKTQDDISLPTEPDYVDGSFHREDVEVCSLTNMN